MARIRTIKPEFFLNEQVASLPFEWRILFVGLWTQADREGRLEDRPLRLKASLFPYDDLNIDHGLGCLVNAGLIIRYEGNGQKLIALPTWAKHQQPHIRESVSKLPSPDAGMVPEPVEPMGREGKGREQEGVHGALRARFERFWVEYPRKTAKDAAWKEWLKRSPDEALTDLMISKVREHKALPQWVKDGGQFIPHPRTWLHQGRWQDEDVARVAPTRGGGVMARREYTGPCPGGHTPPCGSGAECRAKRESVAS